MAPSSRCATSLKPSVAYLVLNFCAGWKKQTILPSLAYAGIPYQVLGERAGALALMMAWSRSHRARSGSGISAIFARTSLSPSALSARGPRRADVFSSWACSFIAARSSAVNPPDVLPLVVLFADFCGSFIAGSSPTSLDGATLMLGAAPSAASSKLTDRHPGKPSGDIEVAADHVMAKLPRCGPPGMARQRPRRPALLIQQVMDQRPHIP